MASLEDLSRELECSICGSVMIDPRVLNCQHTFCLRCIFALIKRDRAHNPPIKCPFGCSTACSTEWGDVRSLKRNPLIASLCAARRRSLFVDPTDAACDWCNSDHVACNMCSRCSSAICAQCSSENMSDHAFLCAETERTTSPTVGDSQDGAAASAGSAATDVVKRYEALVSSKSAQASIKEFFMANMHLLGIGTNGDGIVVDEPLELLFIPHYVQHCVGRAVTSQGGEHTSQYQIIVPAAGYEQTHTFAHMVKKPYCERLWDSKELSILARCISGTEHASSVLETAIAIARHELKALAFPSTSHTDVNLVVSITTFLREIRDVLAFILLPTFRRSALFANFWGHKHVERLCQLFAQSPTPLIKSEVTKRIRAHLELAGGLGKQFQVVIEGATHQVAELEGAIEKLEVCILASLGSCSDAGASREDRPRISKLLRLPDQLESLRNAFTVVVHTLRGHLSLLHAEMPEAVRGIDLADGARTAIITLEKKFIEECDKFLGVCGSAQHVHVLWTQCVIVLGRRFERDRLESFVKGRQGRFALCESFRLNKLNENVEQASRLMATVTPQICTIREQHVALLRRNVADMNGLLVLQGQLCNLTTQVLDVYQKEHFIKLREASSSATEYLLCLSSFVARCYLETRPKESEILGTSPEQDCAEISKVLTNLGSRLNAQCNIVHRSSVALLGHTRRMGRCAAVLLHASAFVADGDGAALPNSSSSAAENQEAFGSATFDEACAQAATEEVRGRISKSVPHMIRDAVTVQLNVKERVLLPYRKGHFFLPQKFPFRSFEYLVDAQTGDFVFEDIPEYGFDAVLTHVETFCKSKALFLFLNVAVATLGIAIRKS